MCPVSCLLKHLTVIITLTLTKCCELPKHEVFVNHVLVATSSYCKENKFNTLTINLLQNMVSMNILHWQ